MKQLLQNMRDGQTTIVEVPVPQPRPKMALVRTAASLVSSGTERMLVEFGEKGLLGKARSRPDLVRQVIEKTRRDGILSTLESVVNRLDKPMPLGYSSAGTIIAIGEGLQGFQIGDRVACAGGGYAVHAEYGVIPQNLMTILPETVDFEAGAFATLGAIAMHGFRLSHAQLGERVAVIGLGLLGLLSTGIARAAGCSVFGIDLDPQRVALGAQMGAEACLRQVAEEKANSFTHNQGFDNILICADTHSRDPIELAGKLARDRAKIIAVGVVDLHIPRKLYYDKELHFQVSRSYGPGRYDQDYEIQGHDYPPGYVRWTEGRNLSAFVHLLAEGLLDIRPLISHRFSIDDAPQAYRLITGKSHEPFLGVILNYPKVEIELVRRVENPSFKAARRGEEIVSLGVLGAGNYASAIFLPMVKKNIETARKAIASGSGLTAQHAAKRFGFRYACSSEQVILEDSQVNTVAILTRHHYHAKQVVAALQHGKHVYCEKPLALNDQELEEIAFELSKENAPLLTVGFNRRFAPFAKKLYAFLRNRSEPMVIQYRTNAGFLSSDHWLQDPEQGGGRIIGEGCHFVDFLTFLIGATPTVVRSAAIPDNGRYHQDNVLMTFSYPDGSLGSVSYLANGDRSFSKERVEVFCEGRVAVLDDFRSLELVKDGKHQRYQAYLQQDKGHQSAWSAFVDSIRKGGPPPIPYPDLWGVHRATFAAVRSLIEQKPISI